MQLLVDVGNSRIKWAFYDKGQLVHAQVASHQNVNFDRFLHHIWRELETPDKVWIANVAGKEIQEALSSWITTTWHQEPIFLNTQSQAFGVVNGYKQPLSLGLDRWLGIVAAFNMFDSLPVCIIDCGTCLTIDVVDNQGYHLGGLLLPGIHTMRYALSTYTDGCQMNSQTPEVGAKLIAQNTHDAMIGGTMFACVAYIERYIEQIKAKLGHQLKIVMSGGEADSLRKQLCIESEYRPHMVLEGILYYAHEHEALASI
jgi:type III pantothenate kinase